MNTSIHAVQAPAQQQDLIVAISRLNKLLLHLKYFLCSCVYLYKWVRRRPYQCQFSQNKILSRQFVTTANGYFTSSAGEWIQMRMRKIFCRMYGISSAIS